VKRQRGVAAVEFALVSGIFFTMLLGVVEMGRLLWTWNAATEATRLGARIAIVCDPYTSKAMIVAHMQTRLATLTDAKVTIEYQNPPLGINTCDSGNCKAVNVKLSNVTHDAIIPFVPLSLTLPDFSTTQRKEFMQTTGNDICAMP
jgi:Flp pilus assembly protein TadG